MGEERHAGMQSEAGVVLFRLEDLMLGLTVQNAYSGKTTECMLECAHSCMHAMMRRQPATVPCPRPINLCQIRHLVTCSGIGLQSREPMLFGLGCFFFSLSLCLSLSSVLTRYAAVEKAWR